MRIFFRLVARTGTKSMTRPKQSSFTCFVFVYLHKTLIVKNFNLKAKKGMEDEDFEELTDEQLVALDCDVAKLLPSVNTRAGEETSTIPQTNSQSDVFAEITNTQFASVDRACQSMISKQREKGSEVKDWDDDDLTLTDAQLSVLDQEIANKTSSQLEITGIDESAHILTASQMAAFDDDGAEPSLEHLECLRSKFKHAQFRPSQWEIIHAVMIERRDVSAVMATGYGKSLCYQFPAVYKNGIVLVISPLISLMKAQVNTLTRNNIRACLVGSAQTDKLILSRIESGEFNIIYSSPEYIKGINGNYMLHLLKNRLIMIAIDGEKFILFFRSIESFLLCLNCEILMNASFCHISTSIKSYDIAKQKG